MMQPLATVEVLGTTLRLRATGDGPPVLLLHGNPTSSFLWRHVLAHAHAKGGAGHRWIAPDLVGMGMSGPSRTAEGAYRFGDHAAHLEALIDALDLSELVVVGHDWGVALALDLVARRGEAVRAVALCEGHLRPLRDWEALDASGRKLFQQLRKAGTGEDLVLKQNVFLREVLPGGLVRELDAEELRAYMDPFPDPASRLQILQWAREVPVGGEPADVARRLTAGSEALVRRSVPTLLVHAEPGVLVTADTVDWFRRCHPGLTVVDVGGPAGHFLPEDRPRPVAEALVGWIRSLP